MSRIKKKVRKRGRSVSETAHARTEEDFLTPIDRSGALMINFTSAEKESKGNDTTKPVELKPVDLAHEVKMLQLQLRNQKELVKKKDVHIKRLKAAVRQLELKNSEKNKELKTWEDWYVYEKKRGNILVAKDLGTFDYLARLKQSRLGNADRRSAKRKELEVVGALYHSEMENFDTTTQSLLCREYNPSHSLWCAYAANLAYADVEDIEKVVKDIWGFTHCEYFINEKTGARGFGMYNDNLCMICFRGTADLKDVMTDIDYATDSPFYEDQELKLHRGFNTALLSVIKTVKKIIDNARKDKPEKPLFLAGHSLGGALANVALTYLSFPSDDMIALSDSDTVKFEPVVVHGVYTFGQPKVGNKALKLALKNKTVPTTFWRITNNTDPVPTVPRGKNYAHNGSRIFISKDKKTWIKGTQDARKARQKTKTGAASLILTKTGGAQDHSMSRYLEAVLEHHDLFMANISQTRQFSLPNTMDFSGEAASYQENVDSPKNARVLPHSNSPKDPKKHDSGSSLSFDIFSSVEIPRI
eukprot:CAMPEP_0174258238 /NCGR_PEP_ID=MMETSP0439-20130205/7273_1 /TAXON_ID=0 /ORGANISM="Stereomyxa ramosa, Strain Chinc5" /LENGTH=528 /DNA_ID=CAMNT_0015341677 /DNA_START=42 /DNA_END=1625 /DNA_ORIENTATION=+